MKKAKYLILLLLLIPALNVKAVQKECMYQLSNWFNSSSNTRMKISMRCKDGECTDIKVTKIDGYYDVEGGKIVAGNLTGSCPDKIGVKMNPYSSPVANLHLDGCHSEEHCYEKYGEQIIDEVDLEPSGKYEGIISCRDSGYKYIKECGCMPSALADLISNLFMIIKIAAPALLLIVGGFSLVKAMSSQDEAGIKKEQQKLIKKFIAAAAIFLIFTLVQFLVTTLAKNSGDIIKCVDYLLNGYNV